MPDQPTAPTTQGQSNLRSGIGLALSGGGYRAMLFHLGSLWRLAELGYFGSSARTGKFGPLGSLQRVSSVSGGSITSAVLGLAWNDLEVDAPNVSERFAQLVIKPIQDFAGTTVVGKPGILAKAILPGSVSNKVQRAYIRGLFGDKTLQDLPDQPRFIFNATNLQSGALWRFSKKYNWDWRVGKIEHPRDTMAVVVTASSAFPPFLSPTRVTYQDSDFAPNTGHDLQRPPFTTRPVLSDGGVYDNLGLETIWKEFKTVLISDAGGAFKAEEKVPTAWARQSYRVLSTIDNQVRSLRKRTIISSFVRSERFGAYWGIGGNIDDYPVQGKLVCPFEKTQKLAAVTTDLSKKSVTVQRQLINWGYAVTDAAVRSHVEDNLPAPSSFPFPNEGVG